MKSRKVFVAGNWKMYKNIEQAEEFAEEFKKIYKPVKGVKVAICAPFLQLQTLKEAFEDTDIAVGAQNMHFEKEGAYTGEVSGEMLTELGIDYVIIGHSERRQYNAETDETVNLKVKKALQLGLRPIMCVGESLETREAGKAKTWVRKQVKAGLKGLTMKDMALVTVAYEPIWAIGTGKTATSKQAQDMCKYIRSCIAKEFTEAVADKVLIQYGGSVKPANAAELLSMPDIDGALVGGASLVPGDFMKIIAR